MELVKEEGQKLKVRFHKKVQMKIVMMMTEKVEKMEKMNKLKKMMKLRKFN